MQEIKIEKPTTTTLTKDTLTVLYYWQGLTLEEIGEIYGITRERVRQLMEEYGLKRFIRKRNYKKMRK